MKKIVLVLALALCGSAFATGNPKPPPFDDGNQQDQHQGQDQGQLQGQAQGQIAEGGDGGNGTGIAGANADANAVALSSSGSQANGNGGASEVNVSGPTYTSKSRALALALPPATADHGSTAPCLTSKRGVTILGVGWSGRTAIDQSCFDSLAGEREFRQCMGIADAYARLGREDLLLAQLQKCGGQDVVAPGPDYVTRDELNETATRVLESAVSK